MWIRRYPQSPGEYTTSHDEFQSFPATEEHNVVLRPSEVYSSAGSIQSSRSSSTYPVTLDVQSRLCPACNRIACNLRTHRTYAHALARKRLSQNALAYGIHNEKANPFAKHPIHMNDQLEKLYNQFFMKWNVDFKGPERHLFPYSRYAAILESAPDDKAVLLGLLSIIATQTALARNGKPDDLALTLQLQVVTAQREALLERNEATDARIATAMCILHNSVTTDHSEDIRDNLDRVRLMLRQRGGIRYLGMNGVLADNFMYIDHLSAVAHNEPPKFEIAGPYLASTQAPTGCAAYQALHLRGLLSDDSTQAATLFTVLVHIYDMAALGKCSASNATYFAYISNVVEFQLSTANAKYHQTNTLDRCLLLGVTLFNHTVFRNARSLAPTIPLIEQRFWQYLQSLQDQNFFHYHNLDDLEVYLACLGTITSLRRPSQYTEKTIRVLTGLCETKVNEVRTIENLYDIMDRYGWSASVCSALYAEIWQRSLDLMVIESHLKDI